MKRPRIFIGSSSEGAAIADAIQVGLERKDFARCTVWRQAFPLSENTIATLFEISKRSDFAVFVWSPDDTLVSRNETYAAARDNVILETGLFMGMHGKRRAFLVAPSGQELFRIPSDFFGFTFASYDPERVREEPNPALDSAITLIKQAIEASSWAERQLDIRSWLERNPNGATFPLKLRIRSTNNHGIVVWMQSKRFEFRDRSLGAPNIELHNGEYVPMFLVGRGADGKDIYESFHSLQPPKYVDVWVPFDPSQELQVQKSLKAKELGVWHFCCMSDEVSNWQTWDEEPSMTSPTP